MPKLILRVASPREEKIELNQTNFRTSSSLPYHSHVKAQFKIARWSRSSFRQVLQNIQRREQGATLLEFAVSIVLFVMLFLAIAEFSLAMYTYHFVSYSAQEAARYAIVHGGGWSSACTAGDQYNCSATASTVQDYTRGLASAGIDPNQITVTTTWPGKTPAGTSTGCSHANNSGCVVDVTVSYPFNMSFSLIPASSLDFTASSEMVIQE